MKVSKWNRKRDTLVRAQRGRYVEHAPQGTRLTMLIHSRKRENHVNDWPTGTIGDGQLNVTVRLIHEPGDYLGGLSLLGLLPITSKNREAQE